MCKIYKGWEVASASNSIIYQSFFKLFVQEESQINIIVGDQRRCIYFLSFASIG